MLPPIENDSISINLILSLTLNNSFILKALNPLYGTFGFSFSHFFSKLGKKQYLF